MVTLFIAYKVYLDKEYYLKNQVIISIYNSFGIWYMIYFVMVLILSLYSYQRVILKESIKKTCKNIGCVLSVWIIFGLIFVISYFTIKPFRSMLDNLFYPPSTGSPTNIPTFYPTISPTNNPTNPTVYVPTVTHSPTFPTIYIPPTFKPTISPSYSPTILIPLLKYQNNNNSFQLIIRDYVLPYVCCFFVFVIGYTIIKRTNAKIYFFWRTMMIIFLFTTGISIMPTYKIIEVYLILFMFTLLCIYNYIQQLSQELISSISPYLFVTKMNIHLNYYNGYKYILRCIYNIFKPNIMRYYYQKNVICYFDDNNTN